jgi:hypothetical protein
MLTQHKQIIVDKEALVGLNVDALCDFVQNHLVLGCDTLLYECATTSQSKRSHMLSRYQRLIKAGAYYCSCSFTFVQWEGRNSLPYTWFLPDIDATEKIRTGEVNPDDALNSSQTQKAYGARSKVAADVFVNLSKKLKDRIDFESPEVAKAIKGWPSDKSERLQIVFNRIDKDNLHEIVLDSVPSSWVKDEARFCMSPSWMSWQLVRLTDAIVQDYYYLRQIGGSPGAERAEHDYQDMEYVLLLSRANGLLTRDRGLASLAKAAFPDKDVFFELDEVPEEYVCHWK